MYFWFFYPKKAANLFYRLKKEFITIKEKKEKKDDDKEAEKEKDEKPKKGEKPKKWFNFPVQKISINSREN